MLYVGKKVDPPPFFLLNFTYKILNRGLFMKFLVCIFLFTFCLTEAQTRPHSELEKLIDKYLMYHPLFYPLYPRNTAELEIKVFDSKEAVLKFQEAEQKKMFQAQEQKMLQAAEQGDTDTQLTLAGVYLKEHYDKENTKKVSDELKQSLHWFKKAAEQGNPEAQTILGTIYCCSDSWNFRAEGGFFFKKPLVEQDREKAVYWFSR